MRGQSTALPAMGLATDPEVVVVGAGPAGLTAAYELSKRGVAATVLEADEVVGGISRTVERDGWRFDIGGHRFFTKVPEVEAIWWEILNDEEFLLRPRMSRIFYDGKYYDYPLRALNALRGLGIFESCLCAMSYLWARVHPPSNMGSFEGWTASRFGRRLYRTFFKTYTEKVWGVPASELKADWAAQRIKDLSLFKAIAASLMPWRKQVEVTSLIAEFHYPKYGPGMMWERARDLVESRGIKVQMSAALTAVHRGPLGAHSVSYVDASSGATYEIPASHVVSSMPLGALIAAMEPQAPEWILGCAAKLKYRDFLTVALVVPDEDGFPDNWIYVHSPKVRVGRIQNFGAWSPYMVKDGKTCLGLEYFVFEADDLWSASDDSLVELGISELAQIGLVKPGRVESGYVVRIPKAYPVYDENYRSAIESIRGWLEAEVPNVYPVGRNGMHRYNNQDHSMLTAMLAVENILGAHHDLWAVNVDSAYHEERPEGSTSSMHQGASGRDAPFIASRAVTGTRAGA